MRQYETAWIAKNCSASNTSFRLGMGGVGPAAPRAQCWNLLLDRSADGDLSGGRGTDQRIERRVELGSGCVLGLLVAGHLGVLGIQLCLDLLRNGLIAGRSEEHTSEL